MASRVKDQYLSQIHSLASGVIRIRYIPNGLHAIKILKTKSPSFIIMGWAFILIAYACKARVYSTIYCEAAWKCSLIFSQLITLKNAEIYSGLRF